MTKFSRFPHAFVAGFLLAGSSLMQPASATVVDFTSSAAFAAATSGDSVKVEQYASGTAGQTIANGGTFNGLTYTFAAGPLGTLTGGIITDQFNSFSGLSLGGNQSGGDQFFFGGDSVTVTFAAPVKAFGAFFNVNANSGKYDLNTSVGNVSTDSAAFDTRTFVFDGITSTTAFSSITLRSEDTAVGSFNIPEIEFVAATPLPAALPLFAGGLGVMGWLSRRRKRSDAAVS
jgi:hypothetical protein